MTKEIIIEYNHDRKEVIAVIRTHKGLAIELAKYFRERTLGL